jgi:hypothetical protein
MLIQSITTRPIGRQVAVRISAWTTALLAEDFHGFLHSLQENTGIVPENNPRPLPSTSFPVNPLNHSNFRHYIV